MFWNSTFYPRGARHPLSEVARMGDVLQRLFIDTEHRLPVNASTPLSVWQQPDALRVALPLPGVAVDEVEITIENEHLCVRSERSAAAAPDSTTAPTVLRSERRTGPFERQLALPFPVDAQHVTARIHNGILWIDLPRAEADKPRKIPVHTKPA